MKPILAVFVLLVVSSADAMAQGTSTLGRWEYQVLTREQIIELGKKDLTAGLNHLGDEGWELIVVDGGYIFKRPKDTLRNKAAEIKRRIDLMQSDVDQLTERTAWAERMAKKGYMTPQHVEAEQRRLKAAEAALENARDELKSLPADPKK